MEDIKFCKYCGQPLEKGANFCNKCGKSINSEQSTTTSQQKTYQQTNFVMDILRGFGKPNSAHTSYKYNQCNNFGIITVFWNGIFR